MAPEQRREYMRAWFRRHPNYANNLKYNWLRDSGFATVDVDKRRPDPRIRKSKSHDKKPAQE